VRIGAGGALDAAGVVAAVRDDHGQRGGVGGLRNVQPGRAPRGVRPGRFVSEQFIILKGAFSMLTYQVSTNPYFGTYTLAAGERRATVRVAETFLALSARALPANPAARAKVRERFAVQAAQAEYALLTRALEDVLGRVARAGKDPAAFGVQLRVCARLVAQGLGGGDAPAELAQPQRAVQALLAKLGAVQVTLAPQPQKMLCERHDDGRGNEKLRWYAARVGDTEYDPAGGSREPAAVKSLGEQARSYRCTPQANVVWKQMRQGGLPAAACRLTDYEIRFTTSESFDPEGRTHRRGKYEIATRDGRTSETVQLYFGYRRTRAEAEYDTAIAALKDLHGRLAAAGATSARFSLAVRCDSALVAAQIAARAWTATSGALVQRHAELAELLRFRSVSGVAMARRAVFSVATAEVASGAPELEAEPAAAACRLPAAEFLVTFAAAGRGKQRHGAYVVRAASGETVAEDTLLLEGVTQGQAEYDTAIAAMQALALRVAQQDLAPADVALRVQGPELIAGQLGGGRWQARYGERYQRVAELAASYGRVVAERGEG
jgi:ribonuclease HI